MSFADFIAQLFTGLATAGSLFLIASGLTLVFGSLRIVNIAHGSFYMFGALTVATVASVASGPRFWLGLVAGTAAATALGLVVELLVLRRLYDKEHLSQLLATFAILYILGDVALSLWGGRPRTVQKPTLLSGSFEIFGRPTPLYGLFIIFVAIVAGLGMAVLLRRTMMGWRIRAAVEDPELLTVTGVNTTLLFTIVFALGALLAGLAGTVAAPTQGLGPGLDVSILVEAFIVSVIGGLGSITGSAFAAVIIGLVESFGVVYLPSLAPVLIYLVMILVLAVRPTGILGARETRLS